MASERDRSRRMAWMKRQACSSMLLLLLAGANGFSAHALAAAHAGYAFPGGDKPSAYGAAATPAPHAAAAPALRVAPAPVQHAAKPQLPRAAFVEKPLQKPVQKPVQQAIAEQRTYVEPRAVVHPQAAAPARTPQVAGQMAGQVADRQRPYAEPSFTRPVPVQGWQPTAAPRMNAPVNVPASPYRYPVARSPWQGRQMAYGGQPQQAAPPRYTGQPNAYPQGNAPRPAYGNGGSAPYRQGAANGGSNNAGDHLPQWLRQHGNQSPVEQERALRQEPGFSRLQPQQQQNLINTLHRLNEMPPATRQRTLGRIENMERLSPQMREAVRNSASQLSALRPDRKRLVQKAFRDLRELPPEERQGMMQSPQFAGQFSAQERSIMGNLLAVEPYARPAQMQPYGR